MVEGERVRAWVRARVRARVRGSDRTQGLLGSGFIRVSGFGLRCMG